jgi:DNA repair protein RecN (Recombination protein N)
VVSKSQNADGMNVTSLDVVEGDDRVFEVARMLAGDTSAASLAHARELLAD